MTMQHISFLASVTVLLVAGGFTAHPAPAQDADLRPDVVMEVDGLACPFCAYGIEKKLKEIDGVDSIEIMFEEGRIELTFSDERVPEEDELRNAVTDAGFTVRKVTWHREPIGAR